MKSKIISFAVVILIFTLIVSGCSSSSIKYQPIEGTSEEFSKAVYDVLNGFEDDLNNDKIGDYFKEDFVKPDEYEYIKINTSFHKDATYYKFFTTYSDTILNKREQEIWDSLFMSVGIVVDSYLIDCKNGDIKYDDYEFKRILKDEAENILQEIQK